MKNRLINDFYSTLLICKMDDTCCTVSTLAQGSCSLDLRYETSCASFTYFQSSNYCRKATGRYRTESGAREESLVPILVVIMAIPLFNYRCFHIKSFQPFAAAFYIVHCHSHFWRICFTATYSALRGDIA